MFGFDGPFGASTPLAISPASSPRVVGHGFTFSASGGTGSGYVFSFVANNSGGTLNTSTGAYVAGSTPNVTDTIRVTDSGANTADATVAVKAAIVISPSSITLPPLGTHTFTATGGVNPGGPAFQFVFGWNNSGGTINSTTGLYTAGSTPSVTDKVRATDVQNNEDIAVITVGPSVSISPTTPTVIALNTQSFTPSGGSGTGYVWSLTVNNSGGSINASTGLYTAGSTGSVSDTVHLVDSLGNSANTVVSVVPGVSLSPSNPTKAPLESQTFVASGGTGTGYVYSISVNNSGGGINPISGTYAAGPTGSVTDTVRAVDSGGNIGTTNVTVTAALSIAPANPNVHFNGTQAFTAMGGSGMGLVWSLSVNNSGGSINASTGLYTAGSAFGVSDTIHVVDSLGAVANTTANVTRLIATWDIEPSVDTQGNLRFTLVSSDIFDMFLVHDGDLAYIYGDEFQPTNTNGTFTIKVVFVTDSEKWFEIENPLGIEMLGIEQINFQDLMFFRPKRRTIYDNPRRVIVCENEQ